MGQKVHPFSFRLAARSGTAHTPGGRTWKSCWFADRDYASYVHSDLEIHGLVRKMFPGAKIGDVFIERPAKNKIRVTIFSARPGVVIGRRGADIDRVRQKLASMYHSEVTINITEIKRPELNAAIVAKSVAEQLEHRVAFRRAMKQAMQQALRMGAKGIRISCSGRLGGAEIARMEWYREGRVPLHTIRADIDYGFSEAKTSYGVIGVKVWIYKGDIAKEAAPSLSFQPPSVL